MILIPAQEARLISERAVNKLNTRIKHAAEQGRQYAIIEDEILSESDRTELEKAGYTLKQGELKHYTNYTMVSW